MQKNNSLTAKTNKSEPKILTATELQQDQQRMLQAIKAKFDKSIALALTPLLNYVLREDCMSSIHPKKPTPPFELKLPDGTSVTVEGVMQLDVDRSTEDYELVWRCAFKAFDHLVVFGMPLDEYDYAKGFKDWPYVQSVVTETFLGRWQHNNNQCNARCPYCNHQAGKDHESE